MPVSPPACASTMTIVVDSHSSVPSDSGPSVGTVQAWTSRRSTAASVRVVAIVVLLQVLGELGELALERLLHHAGPLRIALHHRLGHLLRLVHPYVRRQRRELRGGLPLEPAPVVCSLSLLPP